MNSLSKGLLTGALFLSLALPANAEQVAFRNPVHDEDIQPQHNAVARCANYALSMQLADAVTTRAFLTNGSGAFERDPIAKPFVQSNLTAIGSALIINVGARLLFRHSAPALCGLGVMETAAVVNNIRVLTR